MEQRELCESEELKGALNKTEKMKHQVMVLQNNSLERFGLKSKVTF